VGACGTESLGPDLGTEGVAVRQIDFTDLIDLSLNDIVTDECLKVMQDGTMQFYVVIRPASGMIAQVEGACVRIDGSRGLPAPPTRTSQEEIDDNIIQGRVAASGSERDTVAEVQAAKERIAERVRLKAEAEASEELRAKIEAGVTAEVTTAPESEGDMPHKSGYGIKKAPKAKAKKKKTTKKSS
jgi:hypothetical protein